MNKPHKHAELIKAWADGAEIEIYSKITNEWIGMPHPDWHVAMEYRIKPEPKLDVVRFVAIQGNKKGDLFKGNNEIIKHSYIHNNYDMVSHFEIVIKVIFDGNTGDAKSAEVINNER